MTEKAFGFIFLLVFFTLMAVIGIELFWPEDR